MFDFDLLTFWLREVPILFIPPHGRSDIQTFAYIVYLHMWRSKALRTLRYWASSLRNVAYFYFPSSINLLHFPATEPLTMRWELYHNTLSLGVWDMITIVAARAHSSARLCSTGTTTARVAGLPSNSYPTRHFRPNRRRFFFSGNKCNSDADELICSLIKHADVKWRWFTGSGTRIVTYNFRHCGV